VAVLIDQPTRWVGEGPSLHRVSSPPSPDTISSITSVVSAAVGIVPERGDRVVVEALPFETNQEPPPLNTNGSAQPFNIPMLLRNLPAALALLAVVSALVYFFWPRSHALQPIHVPQAEPVITHTFEPESQRSALAATPPPPARPETLTAQQSTPADLSRKLATELEEREKKHQLELEATGAALQKLADNVTDLARTNSDLCVGVLRSWLSEPKEPTA
jgi:flagellar biosynthesis/type III secretory pathway M-ring protein FliF/YscJ